MGTKDVPDIEFTGYPACRISGNSKSWIPDMRPDIRQQPDTGYPAGYPAKLKIQDCFVQKFSAIFLDKLKYNNKYFSDFEKTFYSKLKLVYIICTRLSQESNSQRKYLCSNTWPDIRPDIWLSRIPDIRPDIRQSISSIRPDTGY